MLLCSFFICNCDSHGFVVKRFVLTSWMQVYGNNVEIQALCEMYNRPIHIYSYTTGTAVFCVNGLKNT